MSTIAARLMIPLALCIGTAATPAFAAPDDGPHAVVRTADLDLATAAGERTLRRRIANAAAAMYGEVDLRDLRQVAEVAKARAAAIASAAPQIETALANARTGRALATRDAAAATAAAS